MIMRKNSNEGAAKAVSSDTPELDRLLAAITPEEQELTDYKMKLAAKIYDGLQKKGWTQTQFAGVMGRSVSLVSRWLSGTHNFTVDTLIEIQRVLNIYLLDVEKDAISLSTYKVMAPPGTTTSANRQKFLPIAGGMHAKVTGITFKIDNGR
jgi:transcriptional regulator with XRE-family HTH domain